MQPHQWSWGIGQWVEFLRDKHLPVLPRTRLLLEELRRDDGRRERLAARELIDIVYADPYLALKLLRSAEEHRSRQLGHDTTTPLAAVLQTGYDELQAIVADSPAWAAVPAGCVACEARSVHASLIARAWARRRADVSPDEVAMAALLADAGELLLWHFAPEMTDQETRVRDWNERFWALNRRPSEIDFTFRQLTTALAQAWGLPALIVMLIKGTDTPRANIARLASEIARRLELAAEAPELAALLLEAGTVVPAASREELVVPLGLDESGAAAVLVAIDAAAAAAGGT